MRQIHWSVVMLLGIALVSLAGETGPAPEKTFSVQWAGEMKRVHQDGDASPRVKLGDAIQGPGTFAIGPTAGLRAEITVLDGEIFIASAMDGKERVSRDGNQEAPFLVYGRVGSWKEVTPSTPLESIEDLERWLANAARAQGLDSEGPFPFKIDTATSVINYHIIANDAPGYQTTRPHKELQKFFVIEGEPATLIGIYSTKHAGIFTHHGSATHIHVVSNDKRHSGHVDGVTIGEDAKFYLPAA